MLPHAVAELRGPGLSAGAALSAVTAPAAEASALDDRKGRVHADYDADLLVVEGDPALDTAALLNIAGVFRSGVRVR